MVKRFAVATKINEFKEWRELKHCILLKKINKLEISYLLSLMLELLCISMSFKRVWFLRTTKVKVLCICIGTSCSQSFAWPASQWVQKIIVVKKTRENQ